MARKVKSTKSKSSQALASKAKAAASKVLAWQDDPISKLPAIQLPVPTLGKAPLKLRIKGTAVNPGIYDTGTPQFRYWNAAAALRRGADFWAPLLRVKRWQPGAVLPVGLDEGQDLERVLRSRRPRLLPRYGGRQGRLLAESPDVVCHELGHACLDAHRPELFDAPYIEVGSFHESFGDMSAILSALQLPSIRAAAISGIKGRKSSQLSRLAEQLGWALRQIDPSLVNKDCLRNAYNSFNYVDPDTLPDDAPASKLCAEVHSFSRVFTGAFYDILSGMLKIRSANPKDADLVAVANDAARLLMDATTGAPVQPDYYAQVASHMIDADTARFGGKYRSALTKTFVKRKMIPPQALHGLPPVKGKAAKAAARPRSAAKAPQAADPQGEASGQGFRARGRHAHRGRTDRAEAIPNRRRRHHAQERRHRDQCPTSNAAVRARCSLREIASRRSRSRASSRGRARQTPAHSRARRDGRGHEARAPAFRLRTVLLTHIESAVPVDVRGAHLFAGAVQ